MGQAGYTGAAILAAILLQAGCTDGRDGGGDVARLNTAQATQLSPDLSEAALLQTPTRNDVTLNSESNVIQGLLARSSVLPTGSAYERITTSVLAANARAAETDLRAARLRAEAASKNWLPTIGPRISLNSLGDMISQIVVEQVLFDNGRKKGERAFAKADVEVAAVALAQDTNDRVATGLGLYLDATQGRETAQMHRETLREMQQFEHVMYERVRGGVSDMSDLNVIRQKTAEIHGAIAASDEAAQTALAELNAMTHAPQGDVRGLETLRISASAAQPLTVTHAQAVRERTIAEARIERAAQLPGISAQGALGENSGAGITAGGAGIGFGTGARLRAIAAAQEAADRIVAQADEDARRVLRSLEAQLAATARQAGEASALSAQAKANLDLFRDQYEAGRRPVIDVVNVYETFAAQQNAEIALKFEALRLQVELARVQGVLADGDRV